MKKFICLILAVLACLVCFASCSKSKKQANDVVNAGNNQVQDIAVDNVTLMEWEGEGNRIEYRNIFDVENDSFENLKVELAKQRRLSYFSWRYNKYHNDEVESKGVKKISFTIESDADVVLFARSKINDNSKEKSYVSCNKISLKSNTPQTITLEFLDCDIFNGAAVSVEFLQKYDESKGYNASNGAAAHFAWGTNELSKWSQTQYKITNLVVTAK